MQLHSAINYREIKIRELSEQLFRTLVRLVVSRPLLKYRGI